MGETDLGKIPHSGNFHGSAMLSMLLVLSPLPKETWLSPILDNELSLIDDWHPVDTRAKAVRVIRAFNAGVFIVGFLSLQKNQAFLASLTLGLISRSVHTGISPTEAKKI